jgi:hypothetical protein
MKEVTLKFSDSDSRIIYCFLRDKYNKSNKITLEKLCEIAIRKEVAEQAKFEVEENLRKL